MLSKLSSLTRCFSEVQIISGGKNNIKIASEIVPAAALEVDEILTSSSGLFSSNTRISDITPFNYLIFSLVLLTPNAFCKLCATEIALWEGIW